MSHRLRTRPRKASDLSESSRDVRPQGLGLLVFLDESGFSLALHRSYGWAPTSERLVEAVPSCRGKNLSVLGALNAEGMIATRSKLGAMKRVDVEAFLREDLLPQLLPGSVLVWDNARIHHGGDLEVLVQTAGCQLLYLPPYSPDFNPIELAWGWIKQRVRRLGPRDDASRQSSVGEAVAVLPNAFAAGWFSKCGYALY